MQKGPRQLVCHLTQYCCHLTHYFSLSLASFRTLLDISPDAHTKYLQCRNIPPYRITQRAASAAWRGACSRLTM